MFLPKFLGGVKGFRENCQGGTPILRFIAFLKFFINKFFENLPGGECCFIPPSPPYPVCIYVINVITTNSRIGWIWFDYDKLLKIK